MLPTIFLSLVFHGCCSIDGMTVGFTSVG